jgi:hypothetical protein
MRIGRRRPDVPIRRARRDAVLAGGTRVAEHAEALGLTTLDGWFRARVPATAGFAVVAVGSTLLLLPI